MISTQKYWRVLLKNRPSLFAYHAYWNNISLGGLRACFMGAGTANESVCRYPGFPPGGS